MATYLEFPRIYCLFTIQLLWAYDEGPFIGEIFIQELSPFLGPIFNFEGFFRGLNINFEKV